MERLGRLLSYVAHASGQAKAVYNLYTWVAFHLCEVAATFTTGYSAFVHASMVSRVPVVGERCKRFQCARIWNEALLSLTVFVHALPAYALCRGRCVAAVGETGEWLMACGLSHRCLQLSVNFSRYFLLCTSFKGIFIMSKLHHSGYTYFIYLQNKLK